MLSACGGWLLPTVAIVKVGGMCGGSRLNSDIKDIFNNSLDDSFFFGSHRIAICPEQGISVMFLSVVFILFTPTQPNPPPTGTFPLRVLSARYRSVFAYFFPFYHSNGLATCSPKRTGTWRNLFWAAKRFCNLDTFWSVPHQSIETSPPLSVELVSPAPPARVSN